MCKKGIFPQRNVYGGHLVFKMIKNIPRESFLIRNMSNKFENARSKIAAYGAVTLKSFDSLHTAGAG